MKKFIYSATMLLAIVMYLPATSQSKAESDKEVKALIKKYFDSWDKRNIENTMDCFGIPEGLMISGGEVYTLDSLRVIWQRDYWNKRRDESIMINDIIVMSDSKTSAVAQVTFSVKFTYIPTETTWEFDKSAFMTCYVKKQNGKWKIVAGQWSGSAKQVAAKKN